MATREKQHGKGKKNRKFGRDAVKCAAYRKAHGGGTNKKFAASKEHRGCGPIGYLMRAQNLAKVKARGNKRLNTAVAVGEISKTEVMLIAKDLGMDIEPR